MNFRTFANWASHTLIGHVVLFELTTALPMAAIFIYFDYSDGTLSFGRVLYLIAVWSAGIAAAAVIFWFTFSRWFVYLRRDTAAMKERLEKMRR